MDFNPKGAKFKNKDHKNKNNNRDNHSSSQHDRCKVSHLWSLRGSCLVRNAHREILPGTKVKVAAFDLDQTLITTKSGHTFPVDQNDFVVWDEGVGPKLNALYNDGWEIVIFSNQLNSISRGIANQIQNKIDQLCDKLAIPMSAYISTIRDNHRKPQCGMWFEMLRSLTAAIDIDNSFYVGDAAGRPGLFQKAQDRGHPPHVIQPADHSADDLNFAINVFVFDGAFYAGSTSFNKSGGVDSLTPTQLAKLHKHFHVPEIFFQAKHHLNYWTPTPPQPPTTATADTLVSNDELKPDNTNHDDVLITSTTTTIQLNNIKKHISSSILDTTNSSAPSTTIPDPDPSSLT